MRRTATTQKCPKTVQEKNQNLVGGLTAILKCNEGYKPQQLQLQGELIRQGSEEEGEEEGEGEREGEGG